MPDRAPYEYDTPVAQQLQEFRRTGPQGAERSLEDLTTFSWDTVHLFSEGDSYRQIDGIVGSEVFGRDGRYSEQGSLLVFVNLGRVVQAVALVPPFISGRAHTYLRSSAILRARTQDPGPYELDFVGEGAAVP